MEKPIRKLFAQLHYEIIYDLRFHLKEMIDIVYSYH
jgi:hypothetical protein